MTFEPFSLQTDDLFSLLDKTKSFLFLLFQGDLKSWIFWFIFFLRVISLEEDARVDRVIFSLVFWNHFFFFFLSIRNLSFYSFQCSSSNEIRV